MKQQKKFAKTNVGVAALGDPHYNGITLISLVITVVVLLILAGVAISIVVSPDGLFTKSEQAKTDWNAKVDEEQIKINEALGYLGIKPPVQLPEGWDSSKVADVVAETSTIAGVEKERKAPIPAGYTASQISTEDEIKEGLVIYQTDTAVTGEANSEAHITAMEGINQYVWIPVDDINDMVMCKHNSITEGSYEENGETITTTTCKLEYDATTNQITCKTHNYSTATELTDDNIDTTGLAGRLYSRDYSTDSDGDKIYQTNMSFTETLKDAHKFVAIATNSNTEYREPDVLSSYMYSGDYSQLLLKEGTLQAITSVNELKHQLNNKFIEMSKSVAKYGGFYISRYEPSYESDKVISKRNRAVLSAFDRVDDICLAGDKWHGLYNKTLNNVEKDESVNSHMIWGCQYDQVIKFLGPEAQTGHTYKIKAREVTGYAGDQDILNNIFDLEGNFYEWTAESSADWGQVCRGTIGDGAKPSSDVYNLNPLNANSNCTARPTLYIAL